MKRESFSSSDGLDSTTENMITIRAENLRTTFYVIIFANNDSISSKISSEESQTDRNCLYNGVIVAPVRGKAAITRCDDSNKMVGP